MPRVILHNSVNSSEDLMYRGNKALVARRPKEAHELYTRILYSVCPGHPCAFMNRCLAYLLMGYPELAVTDAYRAAQMCHELRNSANEANLPGDTAVDFDYHPDQRTPIILEAMYSYLRREQISTENGEEWTLPSKVGLGWLSSAMASYLCSGSSKDHDRRSELQGLEIRSYYRMVVALAKAGALTEAAGLIEDILNKRALSDRLLLYENEKLVFSEVGNRLVEEYCFDIDRSRVGYKEEDVLYWQMIHRMRACMISRVIYPWNTRAPQFATMDENGFEVLLSKTRVREDDVHEHIETKSREDDLGGFDEGGSREAGVCEPTRSTSLAGNAEGRESGERRDIATDTQEPGSYKPSSPMKPDPRSTGWVSGTGSRVTSVHKPATFVKPESINLLAGKDIAAGEPIAREGSILRATTAEPDEAETFPSTRICECCKRTFELTGHSLLRRSSELSSSPALDNFPDLDGSSIYGSSSEDTDFLNLAPGNHESEENGEKGGETSKSKEVPEMRSSSPLLPSTSKDDEPSFNNYGGIAGERYACNRCEAEYCNFSCYVERRKYHTPICEGRVEVILKSQYNIAIRRAQDDTERQFISWLSLHLRMLIRILGLSIESDEHPLNMAEIRYLNGALKAAVNPDRPLEESIVTSTSDDNDQRELEARDPFPDEDNREDNKADQYEEALKTDPCAQPLSEAKDLAWTFDTNVVQPITALNEMGISAYDQLEKFDGWVINTLYAKIRHSIRTHNGTTSVEGENQVRDADDWTGIIWPICSMMDQAGHRTGVVQPVTSTTTMITTTREQVPGGSRCNTSMEETGRNLTVRAAEVGSIGGGGKGKGKERKDTMIGNTDKVGERQPEYVIRCGEVLVLPD